MPEIQTQPIESLHPKPSPLLKRKAELPPWIDIVAFSPTAWEESHSRPGLLMSRCAENRRVFFFEPPLFDARDDSYLAITKRNDVNVITPHLRVGDPNPDKTMEKMLGLLLSLAEIHQYIFWHFSPKGISYSIQFPSECIIYDCINEPKWIVDEEPSAYEELRTKLIAAADLIFTGDLNLYLAVSKSHTNIHLFVDTENPRMADWNKLWDEMNRVLSNTLRSILSVRWIDQ